MAAFDPNQHMRTLQGKQYLDVIYRMQWLRDKEIGKPNWGISTRLVYQGTLVKGVKGSSDWSPAKIEKLSRPGVIFYAEVADETGRVIGTGHGSETADDFAEYIEKAEKKAMGRALAAAGFGTEFALELEEEEERMGDLADSPVEAPAPKQFTPNQDPLTHPASSGTVTNENKSSTNCADCGQPVTGYVAANKQTVSAETLIDKSMKLYQKPLCRTCYALAASKEVAKS